ncbi:MAG: hypothetical protein QOE79_1461 [Sphingomonadales bacterium]|jgi:hypothetical protein|nr:hypothetical protein [Sphingomonadales bacterium]MEA3049164.1 hypothetical protein [Sphingomonadales bacterium]
MILSIALLALAASAEPPPPAPDPDGAPTRAYAACVGLTAVNGDFAGRSIDEAVKRAFERCVPERQTLEHVLVDEFTHAGLSSERAKQEVGELLQSADRTMSAQLMSDIAYHRKTGTLPPHPELERPAR